MQELIKIIVITTTVITRPYPIAVLSDKDTSPYIDSFSFIYGGNILVLNNVKIPSYKNVYLLNNGLLLMEISVEIWNGIQKCSYWFYENWSKMG